MGLFLFLSFAISVPAQSQVLVQNQIDPKALYDHMLESRSNYDFQGVFVYEQGGNIRTFDIKSESTENGVAQSLKVLDGLPQQYQMTFNGYCPQQEKSKSAFLSPYYNFYVRDQERLAGFSGVEIILAPIDKYRYGYQYVIEPESGLLLRSMALTPERRILERIQFTQLEFQLSNSDIKEDFQLSDNPVSESSLVEIDYTKSDLDEDAGLASEILTIEENLVLDDEPVYNKVGCNRLNIDNGWSAGWLPDGFSLVSSGFDGERAALVYSDGLATMSIFIDDVLDSFLPPSTAHRGATTIHINYLSGLSATYLVSIVGEVPSEMAQRVLSSLRRK